MVKIINENCVFAIKGSAPNIKFLVATFGAGLLLFDGRRCTKLHSTRSFGITRSHDDWFVLCREGKTEDIYSFNINGSKCINFEKRIENLHKGVHQIDFIGDYLFVINTHQNSIYKFDKEKMNTLISPAECDNNYYPRGKIKAPAEKNRRKAQHYAHFNSIFKYGDEIMVLAHNMGHIFKRNSELLYFDESFNNTRTEEIKGKNCHNIYRNKDRLIICDSLKKTVCDYSENRDVLFKCDKFTRGLSVSDDYIIVGGTTVDLYNEKNRDLEGIVYILDKNFKLLAEIIISGAQVNEIIRVDNIELTLSNS